MKKMLTCLLFYFTCFCAEAQNSVLINFGSSTCYNSTAPIFSLLSNPLSGSPTLLAGCDMIGQVPNISNVFIAYNPKNNKVYVADIRTLTSTRIWVLDMGLPQNISCPAIIPSTPTYSYSYVSNNFEFDNNGDLWSLSNYNSVTGQCNMDKFDVNTGTVINTRVLQFPAGNFPTSIGDGDLTILPNGRMFATLGSNLSRLYEINNYSSTTVNASATYLQTLPRNCYGIAYLNGQLEITGIDFSLGQCYYFDYNISTNVLGTQEPFQLGQAPIDNSSLTPSVGTTKQLVNAVKVNANTADLTYEVYVKNMGNVIINNINATDDLAAVFGAANVSNVSTSFVAGANAAGLTLNTSYNGTTVTELLNNGQSLPNQTGATGDYFFKVLIQCRVTNLSASTVYMNSAIGKGTVGSGTNGSLLNILDSSNNGSEGVIDPNNNGNASEAGENIPTPFNFAILPVHFISINALPVTGGDALVKWTVATPTVNAKQFEVEYSSNGTSWIMLAQISITNPGQGSYQFTHKQPPSGNVYYRLKEIDNDGSYMYSRIVLLHSKINGSAYIVLPNPANNNLQITTRHATSEKVILELYDAIGRKILLKQMAGSVEDINTSGIQAGAYTLKLSCNGAVETKKVVIVH